MRHITIQFITPFFTPVRSSQTIEIIILMHSFIRNYRLFEQNYSLTSVLRHR